MLQDIGFCVTFDGSRDWLPKPLGNHESTPIVTCVLTAVSRSPHIYNAPSRDTMSHSVGGREGGTKNRSATEQQLCVCLCDFAYIPTHVDREMKKVQTTIHTIETTVVSPRELCRREISCGLTVNRLSATPYLLS